MFMCQRDSFLKEFDTVILSCDLISDKTKPESVNPKILEEVLPRDPTDRSKWIFKIVMKDTNFFPEGGGQPDDRGVIYRSGLPEGNAVVFRVLRNGNVAEHYVTLPKGDECTWGVGDPVTAKIDWTRRFDNMQQHSGQHLITAVADTMFSFPTTSWWLGTDESYIELDTKEISAEQIKAIEDEVNSRIRENVPVKVDVVDLDDSKLKTARGRNLPEDVKGDIRIVTMDGIESNVCCGTHVSNLSQLQAIKLLHVVKKKGKCLLHFLSGDRVLSKFAGMFQTELKLMEILKSCPSGFPDAGEKLNLALKNSRKSAQLLSKDLAVLVATQFKEKNAAGEIKEKLWMYHRDYADIDFGMMLLREIGEAKNSKMILVTLKTEGTSGYFLLTASEKSTIDKDNLVQLGEELCKILDGKGSLQKGNVFQAKVGKLNGLVKAQKAAQKFVDNLPEKD